MAAAWRRECLPAGIWRKSFRTTCCSGVLMGRINNPSLPRSNTFSGPPRANPSRWHHSSGNTVWRLLVNVMVIVFIMVIFYYPKNRFCQGLGQISMVYSRVISVQSRRNFPPMLIVPRVFWSSGGFQFPCGFGSVPRCRDRVRRSIGRSAHITAGPCATGQFDNGP